MEEKRRLGYKDYLLVIGTCLAPMTGLRIWKVGPGEVICLIFCVLNLTDLRFLNKKNPFVRFWVFFLPVLLIGTIWGAIKYPMETFLNDYIIWVFFGVISIMTDLIVHTKPKEYISKILGAIALFSGVWYLLLYFYSRYISSYFIGAPLWYMNYRFSGGATNPHQIAILLCLALVVDLWMIISSKKISKKALYLVLFVVTAFLLRETQSSTAIMALIAGLVIVIWQNVWIKTKNKRALFIIAFSLFVLVCILTYFKIYDLFIAWIQSDANGMDRIELFQSFPEAFAKGPIWGLGPGQHARNGIMEFHNTYLEIIAMSGLVGFFVFLLFSFRIFKKSSCNPIAFASVISLYVYGFAGFGARRLVFWLVIVIAYNLAVKTVEEKKMLMGTVNT